MIDRHSICKRPYQTSELPNLHDRLPIVLSIVVQSTSQSSVHFQLGPLVCKTSSNLSNFSLYYQIDSQSFFQMIFWTLNRHKCKLWQATTSYKELRFSWFLIYWKDLDVVYTSRKYHSQFIPWPCSIPFDVHFHSVWGDNLENLELTHVDALVWVTLYVLFSVV